MGMIKKEEEVVRDKSQKKALMKKAREELEQELERIAKFELKARTRTSLVTSLLETVRLNWIVIAIGIGFRHDLEQNIPIYRVIFYNQYIFITKIRSQFLGLVCR